MRQFVEQPLDAQSIAALVQQSEGWAVSLRLVALLLRQRQDVACLQDVLRACGRSLIDYLDAEVIGHLPADVQLFLARTSILSQLHGPLCDAVVGDSLSHLDSLSTLQMLHQSGIFVTALDAEEQWFQYHGLFRTLLQHKLHRIHAPAEIDALHQRAATWYEQHDPCDDALQQGLTLDGQVGAVASVAGSRPLLPAPQEFQQSKRWQSVFQRAVELPLVPTARLPAPLPVQPARNLREVLTFREMDVLSLLDQRRSNKEIAHCLGISIKTVRQHTVNLYRKLGVENRRQAVVRADALGFSAEVSRHDA